MSAAPMQLATVSQVSLIVLVTQQTSPVAHVRAPHISLVAPPLLLLLLPLPLPLPPLLLPLPLAPWKELLPSSPAPLSLSPLSPRKLGDELPPHANAATRAVPSEPKKRIRNAFIRCLQVGRPGPGCVVAWSS